LPHEAFPGRDHGDLWIYAEAWAHGIDVLASGNRRTIVRTLLEEHFIERGHTGQPVAVRGLFEYACAVARTEGRRVSDVAFEAMPGAVIPTAWVPGKRSPSGGHAASSLTVSPCRKGVVSR